MWEKIKKFIFDRDLYVKDAKRIELLHNIFQTANIVILFISLFASLVMSIEPFDYDFIEGLVTLLALFAISVLYFSLQKVVLSIFFGWLYDTRVLRMNSEVKIEKQESIENHLENAE